MKRSRRRPWHLEPVANSRGQHSPPLWRLWLALLAAAAVAVAFEWALFGLLGGGWNWPHLQIQQLLGGGQDAADVIQAGLALVTPVLAVVTAVFAYRRSKLALAESYRADVGGYQRRFVDAAQLLAHESSVARVAGALSLGSVARDWHAHAQECLDLLARYVRVRPAPAHLDLDDQESPTTSTWLDGEDVVRAAVLDQIAQTLRYYARHRHLDVSLALDLRGAWLAPDADLSEVSIPGPALLAGVVATGGLVVSGSAFSQDLEFDGARILGELRLDAVTAMRVTAADLEALDMVDARSLRVSERLTLDRAMFHAQVAVSGAQLPSDTSAEGMRLAHTWRDDAGRLVTRDPLGPLHPDSSLPSPRGTVVDADGTTVTQAQWFVAASGHDSEGH